MAAPPASAHNYGSGDAVAPRTMVSQGTKALHTGPASPLTSVPLPSPLLAQPPGWLNKCSGHLGKGWQVRLCH